MAVEDQEPDTDLDDDLDPQDPDTDADEQDDGGDGGEYKPPTKGEWERTQRRLKKYAAAAKRPAGKGGSVNDQLAAQLRGQKAKDDEDEGGQDDGEAARWKGVAVRNAAAAQISAAGFTGNAKQAAKLAKLLDTDGIEPDRDGVFDLEDEIEELKEEYPQLFSPGGDNSRRRAPAVRRGEARETPKKTPSERTSDKLLRSAGLR